PLAVPPVTPPSAPGQSGASSGVDETQLLADFGQNRKVLDEVIDVFLADSPKNLDAVRAAGAARDPDALAAAAHALKGSVGLFARGPAFAAARVLEQSGRARDLTALPKQQEDLERALSDLLLDLRAIRSRANTGA